MALTVYTRRMLVERALRVLKVTEANQAPNDEDFATIDELVEGVLESLNARKVFHVQDVDDINPAAFLAVAKCLAAAAVDDFGGAVDVMSAERELIKIKSGVATNEVLKVEYF